MTRHDILFHLPSAQGWALYAYSIQHNGISETELAEPGYIAQAAALNSQPSTLNR